jgi:hypothetical protein
LDILVQILAKAPNLDQMSSMPYISIFPGAKVGDALAAILAKSKMAAIRVCGQSQLQRLKELES